MARTNGLTKFVIQEGEAVNPNNSEETYRVKIHYAVVITFGCNYTSSGDVGYPDESEEYFEGWEAYDEEIPIPKWCTDKVVREQFTP